MALTKVKVILSAESIDKAIVELMAYRIKIMNMVDEFCRRIAEEGYITASTLFGSSVEVRIDPIENGYALCANGDQVGFIEFGAGLYANADHPFAKYVPYGVYPGSWSDEHANTWRLWNIDNDPEEYPYNRHPKMAMYTAWEKMQYSIGEVAKEVFG